MITVSARRAAMAPMAGRLPWSRCPVAPKTTIRRESGSGERTASSARARASVLWAKSTTAAGRSETSCIRPGTATVKGSAVSSAACKATVSTPDARTMRTARAALATLKLPGSPVWTSRVAPPGPVSVNAVPRPRGEAAVTVQSAGPDPVVLSVVTGTGQLPAPLVVDRYHRPPGAARREKLCLGSEVLLHRVVKVQVVLGEVGEPRDVEGEPVHPLV